MGFCFFCCHILASGSAPGRPGVICALARLRSPICVWLWPVWDAAPLGWRRVWLASCMGHVRASAHNYIYTCKKMLRLYTCHIFGSRCAGVLTQWSQTHEAGRGRAEPISRHSRLAHGTCDPLESRGFVCGEQADTRAQSEGVVNRSVSSP
jgi:hypothetical protein